MVNVTNASIAHVPEDLLLSHSWFAKVGTKSVRDVEDHGRVHDFVCVCFFCALKSAIIQERNVLSLSQKNW